MTDAEDLNRRGRFVPIPYETAGEPELSFAAKVLYGLLRMHARLPAQPSVGEDQGPCFPGEATLAKELGNKSPRYVRQLLIELRQCGLISWVPTGRSNRYRVGHPSAFRMPVRNERSSPRGTVAPLTPEVTCRSDRRPTSAYKNKSRYMRRMYVQGTARAAGGGSVNFGACDFYTCETEVE